MATLRQVQTGAMRYVDSEMLPHINGWQKIGFGVISALLAQNIAKSFDTYKNNQFVQMLGIIDTEKNEINVDALYAAALKYIGPEGQSIDVPLFGQVKFKKEDLDKIHQFIKEAPQ